MTNKWNLVPRVGSWNDSKEIVLKKLGKFIEGLALITLVVLSKVPKSRSRDRQAKENSIGKVLCESKGVWVVVVVVLI